MALKDDSVEVVYLALGPIRVRPQIADRGQRRGIAGDAHEQPQPPRHADFGDRRGTVGQREQMIDDVEARLAFEVVDAADIEQHREALRAQLREPRAQLHGRNPLDLGVGDLGANGGWVERGAGDRRNLRTRHGR